MKFPTELEFTVEVNGQEIAVNVRYDFDRGEAQWFDARAGVGSPGCDPSVEITEVNLGEGWKTPDLCDGLPIEQLEDLLLEKLGELEEAENAQAAEAEYQAYAQSKVGFENLYMTFERE